MWTGEEVPSGLTVAHAEQGLSEGGEARADGLSWAGEAPG